MRDPWVGLAWLSLSTISTSRPNSQPITSRGSADYRLSQLGSLREGASGTRRDAVDETRASRKRVMRNNTCC